MEIQHGKDLYPVSVTKRFVKVLEKIVEESRIPTEQGVEIRCHDLSDSTPLYANIEINRDGKIQYAKTNISQESNASNSWEWDLVFHRFHYGNIEVELEIGKGKFYKFQTLFCDIYQRGDFKSLMVKSLEEFNGH